MFIILCRTKTVIKEVTDGENHQVPKPIEAFLEIEPAEDIEKHEKHPRCFGFIRARFEKRLLKKTKEFFHTKGRQNQRRRD